MNQSAATSAVSGPTDRLADAAVYADAPAARRPWRLRHWTRWLQPGLSVKRWVVLFLLAVTCGALGIALIVTHLYRTAPFPSEAYYVTLQFVPRLERGLLLIGFGAAVAVIAFLGLQRSLLGALLPARPNRDPLALAADHLVRRQELARAPKVVAIGGGTGLSTLLRGLKELPVQLTGIVTVCDDGGSSGRLRRDLKVLPPGDFRQCLAALAESEPLVTELFQHRFANGEGLAGHSFGNLFIAALTEITGNFERAVEESGRVLAIRGRILPSTLEDCTLCAELTDRATVRGESRIPEAAQAAAQNDNGHAKVQQRAPTGEAIAVAAGSDAVGIARVYLDPADPAANPAALRALLEADLIVLGPGSLYTSILPNLMVADLARALCWSRAHKLYVCNVATQPGETDGYDVAAHVRALLTHVRDRLGPAAGEGVNGEFRPFTHALVNDNFSPVVPPEWRVTRPTADAEAVAELANVGVQIVCADVVQMDRPTRHEPHKLASAVMDSFAACQRARASQQRGSARLVGSLLRTVRAWAAML